MNRMSAAAHAAYQQACQNALTGYRQRLHALVPNRTAMFLDPVPSRTAMFR
jgi:hypothetical protein